MFEIFQCWRGYGAVARDDARKHPDQGFRLVPAGERLYRALQRLFRRLPEAVGKQADLGCGMVLQVGHGSHARPVVCQLAQEESVHEPARQYGLATAHSHTRQCAQAQMPAAQVRGSHQAREGADRPWRADLRKRVGCQRAHDRALAAVHPGLERGDRAVAERGDGKPRVLMQSGSAEHRQEFGEQRGCGPASGGAQCRARRLEIGITQQRAQQRDGRLTLERAERARRQAAILGQH